VFQGFSGVDASQMCNPESVMIIASYPLDFLLLAADKNARRTLAGYYTAARDSCFAGWSIMMRLTVSISSFGASNATS
jgi:hypothetical protein